MVSAGGELGASKLTGEVLDIMNKMPELVKSFTGIDVAQVNESLKFRQFNEISTSILVCSLFAESDF